MNTGSIGGPLDPVAQAKLVSNEQLKVTSTLLNNCAMAALTTGVIVPIATIGYGNSLPNSPYYGLVGVGWLTGGIFIHLFTRRLLRRLQA